MFLLWAARGSRFAGSSPAPTGSESATNAWSWPAKSPFPHRARPPGDLLLTGIGELVTNDPRRSGQLGLVEQAAVAVRHGKVAWVGLEPDLPARYRELPDYRLRRPGRDARIRRPPHPSGLRR